MNGPALIHTWQLLLVGLTAAGVVANYIYEGRKR